MGPDWAPTGLAGKGRVQTGGLVPQTLIFYEDASGNLASLGIFFLEHSPPHPTLPGTPNLKAGSL